MVEITGLFASEVRTNTCPVIVVESTREIADKIERETRFYITSLAWLANQLGPVIRSPWAIENSLHWVMDMVFRDDECRRLDAARSAASK